MKDEIHDAFKTHKETVEEITSQESNITPPIKGVDEISKSGEVKKEEGLPGNAPKPAISNNKTEVKSDKSERKTVKVILFFSDGSFSEHYPQ